MVNEKNNKEHPGRHCQGCFQTTYSAFHYGAGLLSAGFNDPCKEYVPGLPGRVIL